LDKKGDKTMKERTIITTVEITNVYKDTLSYAPLSTRNKEERKKYLGDKVKIALDADDVVVTNMQEFVGVREMKKKNLDWVFYGILITILVLAWVIVDCGSKWGIF